MPVLYTLNGAFSRTVIGFCAFAVFHSVDAIDQRKMLEPGEPYAMLAFTFGMVLQMALHHCGYSTIGKKAFD